MAVVDLKIEHLYNSWVEISNRDAVGVTIFNSLTCSSYSSSSLSVGWSPSRQLGSDSHGYTDAAAHWQFTEVPHP